MRRTWGTSGVVVALAIGGVAPTGMGAAAERPPSVTVEWLVAEDGTPLDGIYIDLNERGQVMSRIYDPATVTSTAVLWEQGRITRVNPPGVTHLRPLDLSDGGHIVGENWGFVPPPLRLAGFLWHRGDWTPMTDGVEVSSRAIEVNRHGQVLLANVWPPPAPGAAVWDDGEIVTQPADQPPMVGQAINDRGQVAGIHGTPEGTAAAIWQVGGGFTEVGTLGGGQAFVVDISEQGHVLGHDITADGERHAFLWHRGRMIDLGTLGGWASEPVAVNDRGEVIGWSYTAEGEQHAFVWRDGEMIDLGAGLECDFWLQSEATAINDRGQVVGSRCQEAYLWEDGRFTDLNAAADAEQSRAVAINDRGQILGGAGNATVGGVVLWTARPG